MGISMLASHFGDNNIEAMDHSKNSAISRRKTESHYNNRPKYNNIFFQICQSCFWCASNLYKSRMMERCPSCKSSKVGSLPVSANEVHSVHYDG
jgi:hypothetical protein